MRLLAVIAGAAICTGALAQSGAPADVPTNHWAYPAVDNLYKAGILKGYPDGTFKGSRPASRYDLAAALNGLFTTQRVSTEALKQQIADLKVKLDRPTPDVTNAQMDALKAQVAALRSVVAEVKADREQVDPLKDKFQTLLDQLHEIRGQVESAKKDLEKVKASGHE